MHAHARSCSQLCALEPCSARPLAGKHLKRSRAIEQEIAQLAGDTRDEPRRQDDAGQVREAGGGALQQHPLAAVGVRDFQRQAVHKRVTMAVEHRHSAVLAGARDVAHALVGIVGVPHPGAVHRIAALLVRLNAVRKATLEAPPQRAHVVGQVARAGSATIPPSRPMCCCSSARLTNTRMSKGSHADHAVVAAAASHEGAGLVVPMCRTAARCILQGHVPPSPPLSHADSGTKRL